MIEFRAVSKQFPDGTVAVDGFNAVLPSRKTTVLVGSSGSGKTTLLRMINRMVDPTSGSIEIDGENVHDRDPVQLRRSIGYVMQNSGLLPHRKVIDNVATVPLLSGVPKREGIRAGARAARHRRPRPLARRPLPESALRRPAAARRRRARARRQPQHPADGRTVRSRRPDRARRPAAGDSSACSANSTRRSCSSPTTSTRRSCSATRSSSSRRVPWIAQAGSPSEILANPASEFVAELHRRRARQARAARPATARCSSTRDGRAAGVLVQDDPPGEAAR